MNATTEKIINPALATDFLFIKSVAEFHFSETKYQSRLPKILLLFYLVKSQMHDPVRVYFKTGDIAIAVTGD